MLRSLHAIASIAAQRRRWLDHVEQPKDEHDQQDRSETAARCVAPIARVAVSRKRAEHKQQKHDHAAVTKKLALKLGTSQPAVIPMRSRVKVWILTQMRVLATIASNMLSIWQAQSHTVIQARSRLCKA